jgi:hypothetical protein
MVVAQSAMTRSVHTLSVGKLLLRHVLLAQSANYVVHQPVFAHIHLIGVVRRCAFMHLSLQLNASETRWYQLLL